MLPFLTVTNRERAEDLSEHETRGQRLPRVPAAAGNVTAGREATVSQRLRELIRAKRKEALPFQRDQAYYKYVHCDTAVRQLLFMFDSTKGASNPAPESDSKPPFPATSRNAALKRPYHSCNALGTVPQPRRGKSKRLCPPLSLTPSLDRINATKNPVIVSRFEHRGGKRLSISRMFANIMREGKEEAFPEKTLRILVRLEA